MTRRERLEAKLEKRQDWAQGRIAKAAALHRANEPYFGDIAFNTQPGHIPERARAIRRTEKACEHHQMAEHHRQKASGLERQLAGSIFSDDDDALEQIAEKVAKLRADQERHKAINAIVRRKPKDQATPEKLAALVALGMKETTAAKCFEPDFCGRIGIPSYELQNNSANIRRLEKRAEDIKARRERAEQAEAAGGVLIRGGTEPGSWCSVTFSEKPEREILNAMRAAGFRWGGGAWSGPRDALPAEVAEMAA